MVIKQGGNGFGLVLAALILAGAVVYSINVWSTTRKETAPGVKLQQGLEKVRDAAQKSWNQLSDSSRTLLVKSAWAV